MTSLAVKILRDEDGNEFVPYTSTEALYDPDGETIADKIAEKLETSSLIAGTGITLIPDITNHTVEIQSSAPGANLINNVTTSTAGQGALDAYQGYLLNNKIPTKLNQLNDRTTDLLSEPRFQASATLTNRTLFMMTRFNEDESVERFGRKLKGMGVDKELEQLGAKRGDDVQIHDYIFEWKD